MSRLQVTGLAVLLFAVIAYVIVQTRSDAGSKPGVDGVANVDGPTAKAADAGAPTAALTAEAPVRELPPGVSPLPDGAPKTVTFGVILVGYRGAEGAPESALPKPAALDRAKALLAEAGTNFAAAAAKGDAGSTADAGRLPRGVLEPAVEYALFTLQPGGVSAEPIDTPRGYWIVKRLQ